MPGPAADGAAVAVETRLSDVTRLGPDDLAGATLITASALLDLMTRDELAALIDVCAGAGCPVLLTLSVVGRVELAPADPLDSRVAAAFDAHQRRMTARGRLLGPDAVAAAVEGFRRLGAEVLVRPSPWRLGAAEAGLAAEWLTGWVGAACEQEPGLAADADALSHAGVWRRREPAGSPSPSATPTCWCCRDDGDRSLRRGGRVRRRDEPERGGWARLAAAATLAVVVWHLGAARSSTASARSTAGSCWRRRPSALLTTVCCAWRWTIVARGLGVHLSLPAAVAAYYRSLFLNLTLPGGVVGDVHRGVSHGRDVHDVGRGLRAVAWERTAGQVVQAVLTVAVLLVLPSPVRSFMPLVVVALGRDGHRRRRSSTGRERAGAPGGRGCGARWPADLRDGLLHRKALPAVALASAVVVLGHAVTFLIAARTAGVTAPPSRMLPLALLAMLAMVLPSVAGWGPREGATAWAFAAAGLGAERGVATAVVYGVMVLVASLPGALVLVAGWLPRRGLSPLAQRVPVVVQPNGAADA